jgi:hypothetical protein
VKTCLKIYEDASKPSNAIKPRVPARPSKVLRMILLLNPTNENRPTKKSNNLKTMAQVIINGINRIRPCKKNLKNFLISWGEFNLRKIS